MIVLVRTFYFDLQLYYHAHPFADSHYHFEDDHKWLNDHQLKPSGDDDAILINYCILTTLEKFLAS